MWEPHESVCVKGSRCTALVPRHLKNGVHMYPTAVVRMPAASHGGGTTLWRLRVCTMKNGMAVGVKSPALEKGRVFGRQASVGLVWWLSSSGQIYNGSEEYTVEDDGGSFVAGDYLDVKVENLQVSFRVNEGRWTRGVGIPVRGADRQQLQLAVQMLDACDAVVLHLCDPDSVLEGAMSKRANSLLARSPWQTRWFVLKTDALLYRTQRELPAAKMLSLAGIRECEREGDVYIRILHEVRLLRLRLTTAVEREVGLFCSITRSLFQHSSL